MATCRAFIGDGGDSSLIMRIPTAITSIAAAGMSPSSAQIATMLAINDELDDLVRTAPSSMAPSLRAAQLPFRQVADSHTSGGRAVLNTGGVRDAAYAMMSACADAGYRVGA